MTADIYFYGCTGKYGCFSNFYKCKFVDENNIQYNCSEQYLMYQKCLLFDPTNMDMLRKIMQTNNPVHIKALGRQIKNFNEIIWQRNRENIMHKGLLLKFSQNPDIKKILLQTVNSNLYEASRWDRIWGIGFSVAQASTSDKNRFGLNLLGKSLMAVRSALSV